MKKIIDKEMLEAIGVLLAPIREDIQALKADNAEIREDLRTLKADTARLVTMEKTLDILMDAQVETCDKVKGWTGWPRTCRKSRSRSPCWIASRRTAPHR